MVRGHGRGRGRRRGFEGTFERVSSLVQARSPDLFDDRVVSFSVVLPTGPTEPSEPLPDELAAIALPPSLDRAAVVRRRAFLAGRLCALRAIERLTRVRAATPITIAIGEGGAPSWPEGIVGSITHTRGFASAAVAHRARVRGLGLDAETVMSDATAASVDRLVARPGELQRVIDATRWPRATAMTLLFSAKESLFKALYPAVGRRFDYLDAELEEIEPDARRFTARLVVDLAPEVRAGDAVTGRWAIAGELVHTGVAMGTNEPRPGERSAPRPVG